MYDLTLEQLLGDGSEDYWSGCLYVIMVLAGYLEAGNCFIYSQRGSGVVARESGKVRRVCGCVGLAEVGVRCVWGVVVCMREWGGKG